MTNERNPAPVGCNEGLGRTDDRACTCHPDDNPPQPCARKYALSECKTGRDSERLDFLQWLMTRTEFQSPRAGARAVDSDMHIGGGWCSLYVRNMFGNPVKGGMSGARDVRETIDAVMNAVRPNVK
jgi:hypothetical protein